MRNLLVLMSFILLFVAHPVMSCENYCPSGCDCNWNNGVCDSGNPNGTCNDGDCDKYNCGVYCTDLGQTECN